MSFESDFTLVFRSERQSVSPSVTQVYLELSTHCNLRCRSCVRHSIVDFKKSYIRPSLIQKLIPMIEELRPERIVLLGFGEALCHPRISSILALLRSLETKIVLVTNASFLSSAMAEFLVGLPLDELYVSWDDDIRAEGAVIRRGMAGSVFKKNIENAAAARKCSGGPPPLLGLEIVASKRNYLHIGDTIEYGRSIGIERFIVTNLYPYSAETAEDILYEREKKPGVDLDRLLRDQARKGGVRMAAQTAHRGRRCPFIERGTVFITATGDVAPCPELAYTHPAFYFGFARMHQRQIFGNCGRGTLMDVWGERKFSDFRQNFRDFFYPDCSYCYQPDMCYNRTVDAVDCYGNATPCGECLWAKDIVICP